MTFSLLTTRRIGLVWVRTLGEQGIEVREPERAGDRRELAALALHCDGILEFLTDSI